MKCFQLVLICLLGVCSTVTASEKMDEGMAKALIIRQLLSLIDGHGAATPQQNHYKLCTFADNNSYKQLKRNLEALSLFSKPFEILNIKKKEKVASCDSVFLNQPEEADLDWFLSRSITRETLFIVNGEGLAAKGFHLGLFLNKQNTFNFELNADALINSQFTPSSELLQFGKIIDQTVTKKINLLRNLINYTEWKATAGQLKNSAQFSLCTLGNKTLNAFIGHFAASKSFKGKKLQNIAISSAEQVNQCDAVILEDAQNPAVAALLNRRSDDKLLLIGDRFKLGEKGVHYNLAPEKQSNRRFEINLVAFEQTGHSPHFELLNSAVIIEKDYPEFVRNLSNILLFTTWPNIASNPTRSELVDLCIYQDSSALDNLRWFLNSKHQAKPNRAIQPRLVQEILQLNGCEAALVGAMSSADIDEFKQIGTEKNLLLIHNSNVPSLPIFHYQLVIAPKSITIEMNLEQLKTGGFVPSATLLEQYQANSGGSRR